MKPLRILAFVVAGIVALAVAAAIALAVLFDANRLKTELEDVVRAQTGRTLTLAGDLSLAFYPNVGAKLGRATLSERDGTTEFIGLDSAHVAVAVMPLFSGQMVVDEVRLRGLKANIVKHKDGRLNFDDLLGAPGEPRARTAGARGAVRFDVSGIRIEDASIAYRDEASGQTFGVTEFRLRTGRVADDVPGALEMSARVRGTKPATDLTVALKSGYRFQMARKTVALDTLDVTVAGSAAEIRALTVKLGGGLNIDGAAGAVDVSGLSGLVEARLAQGDLKIGLSAPKLALSADRASGEAVTVEAGLRGAARQVEAKLALSGVEGSARRFGVTRFNAQIDVTDPSLPQKTLRLPIEGSLRVDLQTKSMSANLRTRFDESNIKAEVGLASFSPLAYRFDVAIDRLNVDRYVQPSKDAAAGSTDPQIDLTPLRGLDARGKLAIGALQVRNLKLANLKAELKVVNGRADLTPHSADLYQGRLEGALSVNAEGNVVSLREQLRDVAIGPLLRDLAQRDALDGRGEVFVDVTTRGDKVSVLKKAIAGSARVRLKDGAVKGINLAETLRKAKSLLGSKTAQQQSAEGGQKTDFSELTASFSIRDGVAHNNDLSAKAPLFRLGGEGDIDIGHSKLNYLAKASVVATSKGQGGADLAHVAGLTIPVRLSGPFDAVKYDIDYGAIAAGLAKSRVTETVKGAIGGLVGGKPSAGDDTSKGGALKDKLKGLFGR